MTRTATGLGVLALALAASTAFAQEKPAELRIGITTYSSGPASVFGVPARRAAEMLAAQLNDRGGIRGVPVSLTFIDEGAGVETLTSEYHRLVDGDLVDVMFASISSGVCNNVAPLAEDLEILNFMWDCGRQRIFEEDEYDWVHRTQANATPDLDEEFLPVEPMMLEQNAMVLNTGDRLILFDTGMGTAKTFGPASGRLLDSIRASGIEPGEIDAVVLTHAHLDHCWGIMADDDTRNFPNAQIYMSQADFDFWTDEAKLSADGFLSDFVRGARRSLLPNRDRMIFVEDEGEVVPGVTALSTPGHTVGHTSYLIESDGANHLFVGDVVHHYALLFQHPEWEFAFDTGPGQAAQTRKRLFDRASADRLTMIGYHFPFPGIGNIRPSGNAFTYVPQAMDLT